MQPLKLTLKGFRGIRDGLGREEITLDLERLAEGAELIAIAGANGSGKSTIMDNLVPFMVLQSRAGSAGPGGFSYYDHVYLPESLKDLTWSHEGHCYRSQIVVRMNGSRRKTEAFLHGLDDDGNWRPVRVDDGTVSDGRVESYTRCVEHVCGSAETFFTSVFAAQGKRQLNTYRNAEIKTLLADLLGQEEIRCIGQKAGEVARLLKAGLGAIRQEQAGLAEEVARIDAARQRLDGTPARNARAESAKQVAQTVLDAALQRHARLSAEREQSRAIEARRGQLIAERRSAVEATAQAVRALQAQDLAEAQRLERLEQRVVARQRQEQLRRQTLMQSQRRCRDVLGEAGAVDRAVRRLALAQRVQDLRRAGVQASREQVQRLVQCQGALRLGEQRLTGIEREAGKAVLRTQELARRFGLTAEVPCAGTDLQGRCKLLGDAREAQALMPDARTHVARCAQEREQVLEELAHARRQCEALRTVFDVQCFDLKAVESYRNDRRHQAMSASLYANPHNRGPLVDQLDAMLLGAAEVDLEFNVNVTTGTGGVILGGSGGHADTAAGAKLALVTTRLASSAGPKIVERVGCITTPGETIDAIVTEAGAAVHPRRGDLRDRLVSAGIDVLTIEQLHERARELSPGTGPRPLASAESRIVGVNEYRDGRVIDVIRQVTD